MKWKEKWPFIELAKSMARPFNTTAIGTPHFLRRNAL
jgi:hypothetical protein